MSLIKWIYQIASMSFLQLRITDPDGVPMQGAGSLSDQSGHQHSAIPTSVKTEHDKLHKHLATILRSGGQTESAAREVEKLLHPHFVKEEEFAMPPLGMLAELALGKMPADAESVMNMANRLKAEMPEMLAEHKEIVAALQHLRTAAQNEQKDDAIRFADDLIAHATQEEQVLYPSAILVGEYLKLKR